MKARGVFDDADLSKGPLLVETATAGAYGRADGLAGRPRLPRAHFGNVAAFESYNEAHAVGVAQAIKAKALGIDPKKLQTFF